MDNVQQISEKFQGPHHGAAHIVAFVSFQHFFGEEKGIERKICHVKRSFRGERIEPWNEYGRIGRIGVCGQKVGLPTDGATLVIV